MCRRCKRVFTYPRQNITVAGISPAKYQLPAYFDFEIDFSIFLYGLLEALTWTGGARVTLAENSVFGNTKSYNSNSDFLQFLANRYRYYIFKKAGRYSDKKEREKCEEKHKYSSGDLHVFYNNVGFFTNGTGATVERSVDPYTTNPRYRGSLITEVTLWEFSHPAEAPDTPQKPGKSEWY